MAKFNVDSDFKEIAALGAPEFRRVFGSKYPVMCGAMAHGIASVELVSAATEFGLFASFGAGGLTLEKTEVAIEELNSRLGSGSFAMNFLHNHNDPSVEERFCDLYLRTGIQVIEASAFFEPSLPLVRFALSGISKRTDGKIETPNTVIVKLSRREVAEKFLRPASSIYLSKLVSSGALTAEQAEWSKELPLARAITVEADSGGHTDSQSLFSAFPTILSLKERVLSEEKLCRDVFIGAAGGISTPSSIFAAFAMGADYVVTGSINQSLVESGTSSKVKTMLANLKQADVRKAPAADMFEIGAKVQVAKSGTMFPMRAAKLFDIYQRYGSIEEIPEIERNELEKKYFRRSLPDVWESTREYFLAGGCEEEIRRAEADPKHKLALVLRAYLGLSLKWAIQGEEGREIDYQIWAGPALGAFNEWCSGTALEVAENRSLNNVYSRMFSETSLLRRKMISRLSLDREAEL